MELTIDFPLTTGQLCRQTLVDSLKLMWDNRGREKEQEEQTHTLKTHKDTQAQKHAPINHCIVRACVKGGTECCNRSVWKNGNVLHKIISNDYLSKASKS